MMARDKERRPGEMDKKIILFKMKGNPKPRPVLVINVVRLWRIKRFAKRVFGFENCKPDKYLKSPELDEVEVSVQLTKLEADMNWTKRLLWLLICGSGAGFYFD